MILTASAAIEGQKQAVNELNVFPVPDGDTGTNMSMTIGAAAKELAAHQYASVGEAADAAASALLRGARGNSGVILSLLFRGFARRVKRETEISGQTFAEALQQGVEAAYKAVMKPAEGTVLTVSRMAAARAAEAAGENGAVEPVLAETIAAAEAALQETVHQNLILEKANVIDAGGRGFVIILQGMLAALRGETVELPQEPEEELPQEAADFGAFDTEDIKFAYCTEFIIERGDGDSDVAPLRAYLDALGDSLVLVDDEEIIKIHVHSNHPGKVLEKALTYGTLSKIKIENMKEQHTQKLLNVEQKQPLRGERVIRAPEKKYGFVAVCAGAGLAAAFRDLGADQVIEGGQTMNPSTEDILTGIDATPAETVFVFPNNKNIIMAAEQCIPLSEKKVIVVPTRSIPQGVTALLAFDETAEISDNKEAMMEAAAGVRSGQVTYAARSSDFDGRKIKKGDYLAMVEGRLVGNGKNVTTLLKRMAEEMAGTETQYVTIFYGQDVVEEDAEKVKAIFEKAMPQAEVTLLSGGQPVYYYLISAE